MKSRRDAHPAATEELIEAAKHYESDQLGLGSDFLDAVERAVHAILDWPEIAPVFPGWEREPLVRTMRVDRFPYRVLYYLSDAELTVVAYAHDRRKPGYWKDRV